MPPSFSVIVPTYGRPEYLRAAVDSVLAQTVDDLECIVVDDATPIPVPRPSQDPRVRLVSRARNGGPAAARNSGLQAATGTYVAFLDDDDVWVPDRLEQALDQHRRAPLVVCFQSVVGGSLDARGRQLEGDVADSILDSITPHLGATTCARDDLLRFDETYRACEDVEWWLRIAQHARVATATKVGLLYRAHGGARTSTGHDHRLRGNEHLLDQHAEWFRTHPRARAFRLKRMGLSAMQIGERNLGRRCLAQSFRVRPEPTTAWQLLRACIPARGAAT